MLFAPFNYRQTMGIFTEGKMRPIISAIINIVVSIVFAKVWGLAGVLWGTAIARLTTNVWFDPYLVFKRGMDRSPIRYYIDYIVKAMIFFVIGGICLGISSFIPDENILQLLFKAIVTFGISNIAILGIYFRTNEFKYLFNVAKNFKNIIKNKS